MRLAWRQFCTDVSSLPAAARLHRILKKDRPLKVGSLRKANGEYTTTPSETLKVLLDAHFPDHNQAIPQTIRDVCSMQRCTLEGEQVATKIVTKSRVCASIKSFKPFKSPGQDGIYPVLLQKGLDILVPHLIPLYRSCIVLGYVPIAWQCMRVVFPPKPGKSDYTLAKSYRPLSLTSFLLKTLERLVYWYLLEGPLKIRPLHSNQFAYRAGLSTETALHCIVTRLRESCS